MQKNSYFIIYLYIFLYIFIIITVAAKVTSRPLMSPKWGVGRGCTCREGRTGQVTRHWPARYSMPCSV